MPCRVICRVGRVSRRLVLEVRQRLQAKRGETSLLMQVLALAFDAVHVGCQKHHAGSGREDTDGRKWAGRAFLVAANTTRTPCRGYLSTTRSGKGKRVIAFLRRFIVCGRLIYLLHTNLI